MLQAATAPKKPYVLGHSDEEMDRLVRQSQFFDQLTESLLRRAGLRAGMRVLDIGSGAGDVAFLASSIVGPQGAVLGIDKSPEAVEFARQRAAKAGLSNVHFLTGDAEEWTLDEPVDALIGRLVLMYFVDPAVVLRRLVRFVKPGGLVVFHELDMHGATSKPFCETFETAVQRIRTTFTRAGIDDRTGLRLPCVFREAGLPAPQMLSGARVEFGPDSPIFDQIAHVTRSLLPLMLTLGVATSEEIGIESLADRIREDATEQDATLASPSLVGAWVQKVDVGHATQ